MRASFSSIFLLCLMGGGLLASVDAHAAGASPLDANPQQKKEATTHFLAGKKAFESGDPTTAILELTASLEVVDSPNARIELARALRDSSNLRQAWLEYSRAFDAATLLAAKEDRYAQTAAAAKAERDDVARNLAFLVVAVKQPPAGAILTVGGRAVAAADWGAPIAVSPGAAVDVALTDGSGAPLAHRAVEAQVGQTVPVSLDLSTPAPAVAKTSARASEEVADEPDEAVQAPAPAPAAEPRTSTTLRTLGFVGAGVGLAGLGTFAVFGILSNAAYNDLKSSCSQGCPPDKRGEIDSGAAQQTVANIGLVVGLAGAAAGATFFILHGQSGTPTPTTGLVVGPGYLGVRGTL